ncbi:hypothetical protein GLYMA_05G131000v4 [Glycine max]|uniref:Uncharacterized protein n=1 Tax=Glycine max TaxID=3847 RepID=K7KPY8_SOYBN|nr:hypothetical protein JHK85_013186 [Glycine max]KAG5057848.1 hypothetical protein JHK86_012844 [Glycine max]KAH1134119.1 hypothetical protein GYH30_012512 [Glycine max]KRH58484.1 hypothetical protein GLYMA_05G131000v4 [Glycine max]
MSSNPKDISKSLGETRQSQQSANNNGSNPKDISKSLGETRQSQQSANNNGSNSKNGNKKQTPQSGLAYSNKNK